MDWKRPRLCRCLTNQISAKRRQENLTGVGSEAGSDWFASELNQSDFILVVQQRHLMVRLVRDVDGVQSKQDHL